MVKLGGYYMKYTMVYKDVKHKPTIKSQSTGSCPGL